MTGAVSWEQLIFTVGLICAVAIAVAVGLRWLWNDQMFTRHSLRGSMDTMNTHLTDRLNEEAEHRRKAIDEIGDKLRAEMREEFDRFARRLNGLLKDH